MRVLVTWGSKRGGTEGIARSVGEALQAEGVEVEVLPPGPALRARGFDAAIVGGALYAGLWQRNARQFVTRRAKDLRSVPVWFFSSGPLDDSAERQEIPPVPQVRALMERVGAQGHASFGGRLAPDAKGFPASAMAKKHAGDYRNQAQIRAWARAIAQALPAARPGPVVTQPGSSVGRLVMHGVAGWAACAAVMAGLLAVASTGAALAVHAIAAPLIFALVAQHYFQERGAREALPAALAFMGIVALLDLAVVGGLVQHSLAMFGSIAGTWLPLALIGLVTWGMGQVRWMVAATREAPRPARA